MSPTPITPITTDNLLIRSQLQDRSKLNQSPKSDNQVNKKKLNDENKQTTITKDEKVETMSALKECATPIFSDNSQLGLNNEAKYSVGSPNNRSKNKNQALKKVDVKRIDGMQMVIVPRTFAERQDSTPQPSDTLEGFNKGSPPLPN